MDISVFTDPGVTPDELTLKTALGKTYLLWTSIKKIAFEAYPAAAEEWNYSGKKFGWSFRIKDKKRVIIYLLPRRNYFKVAFVFGQKATEAILQSDVDASIRDALQQAKPYAEGRGIRVDVRNKEMTDEIRKLIGFKVAF